MALVIADRVKETTTTTGTGTINLAGTSSGFQTFVSGVGNSNTTYYTIEDANGSWEIGIGTVTDASPDTLARTTVLATSNGDTTKITLSSGTHTVFGTYAAGKAVYLDASGVLSHSIVDADISGSASIANSKLANSSVNFGGVSLSLGGSDTTPAFNLSDATNYPTSSLSGTITNTQLAGSIANAKLANSSITVAVGSDSTGISLGGTITFAGTSNEVEVSESSGTITIGLPSTITANVTGNVSGTSATVTGGTQASITSAANLATVGTITTGTWQATDVAVAHGGTGASTASAARTNLGVDAAGTDNSTDVTLAGTPDYITISGQEITRNAIDLTADVTGTLPVGKGGTGLTSIATLLNSNVTPTTLSLVIGTNVQAYDAQLATLAGLTADQVAGLEDLAALEAPASDGQFIVATGAGAFAYESGATVRTSLGLGSIATLSSIDISANTNLAGGTGITLTGDTLSTTDSEIVHDNLSGFVANEHVNHTSVSIASGTGLSGGGDLTSTRTLSVDASQTQITAVGTLVGLTLDGDKNITPGDGSMIHLDTSTLTDNSTSGSSTTAKFASVAFEGPTLAATNSSVTTTDAATVYISAAPTAGTNQTLTNAWALWVDAGNVRFDGSLTLGSALAVAQGGTGATSLNNLITLGTHTTGNYVATVADAGSSRITVANSGAETAGVTLDIADNAVGIAQLAGIARGKIIVGDSSGDPALLAVGSANTVLQSDGTDATWGTVSNAMLAGSIANAKLSNSSITVSDGSNTTAVSLGGTMTFSGTSNEVEVAESSGTVTIGLPSTITANVTGNVSGTAATVTGAAQSSITSLGTLTTLSVDDIIINASTIDFNGSTGDNKLDLVDNIANGLDIVTGGSDSYMKFNTQTAGTEVTYSKEAVEISKPLKCSKAIHSSISKTNAVATSQSLKGGGTGNVVTLDLAEAGFFRVQLDNNVDQIWFKNQAEGQKVIIRFEQDGTGSRTVDFSAFYATDGTAVSVNFPGGTAPTLTTTASKADIIGFLNFGIPAGSVHYYNAVVVGQNFSQ